MQQHYPTISTANKSECPADSTMVPNTPLQLFDLDVPACQTAFRYPLGLFKEPPPPPQKCPEKFSVAFVLECHWNRSLLPFGENLMYDILQICHKTNSWNIQHHLECSHLNSFIYVSSMSQRVSRIRTVTYQRSGQSRIQTQKLASFL